MFTFSATPRGLRRALGFVVALFLLTGAWSQAGAQDKDTPKLAGTWTWSWKDRIGETHRHVLEVEGVGTKLAARELFDDQAPIRATNLTLDGRSIRFSVVREGRKAEYAGKVANADHINGTVTLTVTPDGQSEEFEWKAERRKDIPK